MESRVFAILLAAGLSKRFGHENKLLVPFRGKALAQHTIDLVCSLKEFFDGIFLVYSDERVAALVNMAADTNAGLSVSAELRITFIHNKMPEKGQQESVRLGTQAAQANENDFLMFFPCDQPFLDADTVRKIIAVRRKGVIVEPCVGFGVQGFGFGVCSSNVKRVTSERNYITKNNQNICGSSPSLFSGVFLNELLSLREGEAPRVIKARHSEAVIQVTVTDPLILTDIDDRETLDHYNFQ